MVGTFLIIFISLTTIFIGLYFMVYPMYLQIINKAPFVPAPRHRIAGIIQMMSVHDDSVVYDLGCGDGRILLALYKENPNATYIGIENEWFPFLIAKLRTRRIPNITVRSENFFKTDLSDATHIFTYLYPGVMKKLEPKLERELDSGDVLVSLTFPLKKRKANQVMTFESGLQKIYRYEY